jgi:pimeloyl-ACP methyl ester carboxylesterase
VHAARDQQHDRPFPVCIAGEGHRVRVCVVTMRHGYADLGDVRLHYVEAGEGPLVVLLHGFPEFWYGWRAQIEPLAAAGFRVVVPDMRGYNLSSKPAGVGAYDLDPLTADVRNLILERGETRAWVAGHDWGGAVAWATAMFHPEVVERLAILNAPHPRRFLEEIRHPRQAAKSWYMGYFQLPWVPERLARARDFWMLRSGFEHDARPGAFSSENLARYTEAWSQPGALTGSINYYRALSRQTPRAAARRIRPIEAPTRVIWGTRDRYLGRNLAEPRRSDVPNLERVIHLDTSHWVQHDEPEQIVDHLTEFFGASR